MKRCSLILVLVLICSLLAPVSALAKAVPYKVYLDAGVDIYDGPGYDYPYEGDVSKYSRYTILEEDWDEYGNLWGRLKSGAGWVVLQEAYADSFEPYTIFLLGTDGIFEGPGYDYDCIDTIGKDNRFTIVEEAVCEDGYLWGRLKSGAGWVKLPNIASERTYKKYLGAWVPIFEGPGYDYVYEQLVGKDNTYTIVMEVWDDEGNLWGKLKSGAGWVDLDYVGRMEEAPIIISFADDRLLASEDYREYTDSSARHRETLAFRSNETLTNVRFNSLGYRNGSYVVEEELYSFGRMRSDWPFVASVPFMGDMTTYGISFTDADGHAHHYAVCLSGRNGFLDVVEYFRF